MLKYVINYSIMVALALITIFIAIAIVSCTLDIPFATLIHQLFNPPLPY